MKPFFQRLCFSITLLEGYDITLLKGGWYDPFQYCNTHKKNIVVPLCATMCPRYYNQFRRREKKKEKAKQYIRYSSTKLDNFSKTDAGAAATLAFKHSFDERFWKRYNLRIWFNQVITANFLVFVWWMITNMGLNPQKTPVWHPVCSRLSNYES